MYITGDWFIVSALILVINIISGLVLGSSDKKGKVFGLISFFASFLFLLFMGFSFIDREDMLEILIAQKTKTTSVDDIKYDKVTFMGKYPTRFNMADQRPYIIHNEGLVSYHKVIGDKMCRNCDQFSSYSSADSVYLYLAVKPKNWFFSSQQKQIIFSKVRDFYLETFTEQKEITK